MKISASVVSHPGNCREKNEDNFCFNGKKLIGSATPRPIKFYGRTSSPVLMGIFDGMGGIKAGEIASCIAADVACSAISGTKENSDMSAFLVDICKQANVITCNEMLNVIKQRIGTTASMLCFKDERYYLCNIGDSPIYLFRNDEVKPIFQEHTEKENYLRIHGVNAILPKKKFKLTQNIGIFPEEMDIEPFVFSEELKSKDRFLITSDGLTDMVDEVEITEVLRKRMSPTKTVKRLLQQALENGGKDNTTIICIDIK